MKFNVFQNIRSFKILTIGFISILPVICFGQYKVGGIYDLTFFSRLPSARAEAMGKAYCSIDGDLTTAFFNPAGTATIKGFEINGSLASPFYLLNKAKFGYISSGYKINNYLILGLSWNYFNSGYTSNITDDMGNLTLSYTPYNSNYSLNVSSQLIKNLFFGLNANLFTSNFGLNKKTYTPFFDFGAIKKFEFLQKLNSGHSVNLGASIVNLAFAKGTSYNDFGKKFVEELPVITRFGINYQYNLDKNFLFDSLKTLRLLVQADYQRLLNSDYYSGIHTGGEIQFFEILSLRIGYYNEKIDNKGNTISNNSDIHSFTYGIGLQIPLYKLTKLPLNINFDYISSPQPSYIKTVTNLDNFTSYNLRLNWMLKNKK
jgi:hypothetical protein